MLAAMCVQADPRIAPHVLTVGHAGTTVGSLLSQRRMSTVEVTAQDVVRKDPANPGGQVLFPGIYVEPTRLLLDTVPADRLIRCLSDRLAPHGVLLVVGRDEQHLGDVRKAVAACGLNRSDSLPANAPHVLARKQHVCCADGEKVLHDRNAIWLED